MFCRLLLFTLALSTPAFAYLDPVTGNIIIQFALAGVAAVAVTFGRIKNRVKEYMDRRKNPPQSKPSESTNDEDFEDEESQASTQTDAGSTP